MWDFDPIDDPWENFDPFNLHSPTYEEPQREETPLSPDDLINWLSLAETQNSLNETQRIGIIEIALSILKKIEGKDPKVVIRSLLKPSSKHGRPTKREIAKQKLVLDLEQLSRELGEQHTEANEHTMGTIPDSREGRST